jgi:hypothetical protein
VLILAAGESGRASSNPLWENSSLLHLLDGKSLFGRWPKAPSQWNAGLIESDWFGCYVMSFVIIAFVRVF